MADNYDLTIVVVTYNSFDTIARCLLSLREYVPKQITSRVVVVDNASCDGTAEIVRSQFPEVHLLQPGENLGFGKANNLAMQRFPARYYYLHNADAYLQGDSIDRVVGVMDANPKVGIAGLPLVYPDQSPQTAAYAFTSPVKWGLQGVGVGKVLRNLLRSKSGRLLLAPVRRVRMARTFMATATPSKNPQLLDGSLETVDWVCGASFVISESARAAVGGFDEIFFLYCEDEDLCHRVSDAGWQICQISVIPVIHDFGWGKSGRSSPIVARLKADSHTILINRYFLKGSMSWIAMHAMLWIKARIWGADSR